MPTSRWWYLQMRLKPTLCLLQEASMMHKEFQGRKSLDGITQLYLKIEKQEKMNWKQASSSAIQETSEIWLTCRRHEWIFYLFILHPNREARGKCRIFLYLWEETQIQPIYFIGDVSDEYVEPSSYILSKAQNQADAVLSNSFYVEVGKVLVQRP